VEEIFSIVKGNRRLAKKVKASPDFEKGYDKPLQEMQEEKEKEAKIGEKEAEIQQKERTVGDMEKILAGLKDNPFADAQRVDALESGIHTEKEAVEQQKENLENEKKWIKEKCEASIEAIKSGGQEAIKDDIGFAIGLVETYQTKEGKGFDLDREALRQKVGEKLKTRENITEGLRNRLDEKEPDLEKYEYFIGEAQADFAKLKNEIEKEIQEKVIGVLNNKNFTKELREKHQAYLKETGKRLFKNKLLIAETEKYFKDQQTEMTGIINQATERIREYFDKYIKVYSTRKSEEKLEIGNLPLALLEGRVNAYVKDSEIKNEDRFVLKEFNDRIKLLREREKLLEEEAREYSKELFERRDALHNRIVSDLKL